MDRASTSENPGQGTEPGMAEPRESGNKLWASSVPSRMPVNAVMTPGRRLAASSALIATGAGVAAIGLSDLRWIEWSLVASSGVIALAGVGLSRKSMIAQALARATAWLVFAPAALVAVLSLVVGHHPELAAAALAAGSGGALVLARPMLHTAEARAEFAPSRLRSWLLAGATASTFTGMVAGVIGLEVIAHDFPHHLGRLGVAGGFLTLAAALIGSAFGVLRMRSWGILLGGLTSFVTLAAAVFSRDEAGVALALSLAALPGLLFFVLPVLIAKQARAKVARSYTRIALPSADAELPSRVRVATDETDAYADEFEASPAPAVRAQHVA